MWTHSPARNRHIGGISIGIHPIMARYASKRTRIDKWGRWVEVDLVGKKNKITTVIGTYGPTGDNTSGKCTMWKYQQNEIEKEKNPEGKKRDTPKERYRNDLEGKM
jgi:hypothetical protein